MNGLTYPFILHIGSTVADVQLCRYGGTMTLIQNRKSDGDSEGMIP